MRMPLIPETLSVCALCHAASPWRGKQECIDCVLARRFAAWAAADGELPPGLRFVGDGVSGTFQPASPFTGEPCPCGCGLSLAVVESWQMPPRITEVPLPRSTRAEAVTRRVTSWVGLLVLWAFTFGWLFGRFAR